VEEKRKLSLPENLKDLKERILQQTEKKFYERLIE